MKTKQSLLIILGAALISMTACNSNNKKYEDLLKAGVHTVIVQDVIQTSQYTYLHLNELGNPEVKESDTVWAATDYFEPAKGDTLYFRGGFPMQNFKSKELKRGFKKILFLDSLSKKPMIPSKDDLIGKGHNYMSSTDGGKSVKPKIGKLDVTIEKLPGFITVGELFENKTSYSGKTVKIRGQVVKFSADIMGKNWIHIQDGTEGNERYDLTVTTMATFKEGDRVNCEGKIGLDRDLGHGYFYEVIMEDAKVVK